MNYPITSPWKSAVQVEDYQLYPVLKSMAMPRVSLLLADDLLNCSQKYRTRLEKIIKRKHPNLSVLVDKILTIASSYELLDPNQNLKFSKELSKSLDPDVEWREINEIEYLRVLAQKAEKTKNS